MTAASIRYKNPGAMWGGSRANKWGAVDDIVLADGQKNHIAVFPTFVQGAAAQFDLWRAVYTNISLSAAVKKWSGGNSDQNYVEWLCQKAGIEPSTKITVDFLASSRGLAMMKAQAHWEAGGPYPMTDAEWKQAQDMVFKGAVGPKVVNVQPPRAAFDEAVEAAQNQLKMMGYYQVGAIDGLWGGNTAGALSAFLTDRGSKLTVSSTDRTVSEAIQAELTAASRDRFVRPVAPSRANATAADIAPKNEAVRQSRLQGLGAQVAGWFSAGAASVAGVAQIFPDVKQQVSPIQEYFTNVPGWAWFAGIAAISFVVLVSANRVKSSTIADYNAGKIN